MIQLPTQIKIPTNAKMSSEGMTLGRVGIVTNSFESAYYSHLVEAASNYLAVRGFQPVVQGRLSVVRDELAILNALSETSCDGLIIHADTLADEQLVKFMHKEPNAVLLNRYLPSFPDRCVHMDNVLGGSMAARFLVSQGHTRIAMVRGPNEFFEANDRALGFIQELKVHDLELGAKLYGNFWHEDGAAALERIHTEHPDITAIFFQNDEMAFGALQACRRLNVRVPDELSIIGFDGVSMIDYVSPRLTSVKQPLRQIAEHAAMIVCDLISNVALCKRTKGASFTPVVAENDTVSPPPGHYADKISLTQRESECLTWTAKGKTSWEISVILGVSESTATFHLRNAGVKLKASNRAHTVAKALHLGLIKYP